MKKFLTILSIFMSVICSSIFLVSCSKGYDDMYLTIEYLQYDGAEETWKSIEAGGSTDYYLSNSVYSEEEGAYLLYLRINVKGTSKKVDGIFISRSANNSAILEADSVKPGEAFKVWVKNVGSINFTAVPSNGGDDKAVEFGVNVYRKLESIEQNKDCVPAVVVGGNITFGSGNLSSLIKYGPFDSVTGKSTTNQTGVNYTIEGLGTLVDEGQNYLIDRRFDSNDRYTPNDDKTGIIDGDNNQVISFGVDGDKLTLNVDRNFVLTTTNNVIKLKATSVYDETKTCDVYVYIVDNFKDKFLVSYNSNATIGADGGIDTKDNPIDDKIVIYDAQISSPYRSVKVYAYASSSIYSFVSEPGMSLKVYVDGELYDYENETENDLGVKISPTRCDDDIVNGMGLMFEAKSQSEYKIKLELNFSAFDFSGSDTSPMSVLNKEFTLQVGALASGFNVSVDNGTDRTYADNLTGTPISLANIYSYYNGLGMPIKVQAVPTNAQNANVRVAFYEDYSVVGKEINGTPISYVQLAKSQNVGIPQDADGWFGFPKGQTVYLKFLEDKDLSGVQSIYMVCSAVSTPDKFRGEQVSAELIYFISKLDVVGSVKDLYVYKNETDRVDEDTLTDSLLQADANQVAYIGISSGVSQVDVDLSKVVVKVAPSKSKDIQLSVDGINWASELTMDKLTRVESNYKLYFKANAGTTCGFTISSPNGVEKTVKYGFVNVTSDAKKVDLKFEKTYIWQSEVENVVELYDKSTTLHYLALQSNSTVKFEASGDGKSYNIKSLSAYSLATNSEAYNNIKVGGEKYYAETIQNFSSRAVVLANQSSYFFDVKANTSGFTSVVLVKVDFYIKEAGSIQEDCKYFLYEIAVYNPANSLNVTADKDSIIYVNDNYKDVARVTFTVTTNPATQRIYFSSTAVNESININYGEEGRERIYAIEVSKDETISDDDFTITGLKTSNVHNSNRLFVGSTSNQFSIEAKRTIGDKNYIYVDFTIYQFGMPTTRSLKKVIYLGTYTKSDGIIVEGVDVYNNIYLSLQSEEQAKAQLSAQVRNDDATYKDLDYQLYTLDTSSNKLSPYSGDNLIVTYLNNGKFNIKASEDGGTYQLTLYAKDSYDADLKGYRNTFNVVVNVSSGTEKNPYLIRTLEDFEKIAETDDNLSKHYRLANDINLSALSDNWWGKKQRVFSGTLDGAMTIYNAEDKVSIQKQYVLKELNITTVNEMTGNYNTALFASLTKDAVLKNLMLDRVQFNLELNEGNSGDTLNISALVSENNGSIQNCSVNIISSTIKLVGAKDGAYYNIGVLVGRNNGKISYDNSQTATNYASMIDCNSSGVLRVVVERNAGANSNFDINIGGISGVNTNNGEILATYKDGSAQSLKYLLTGVVNIDFVCGNNKNEKPETVNANIGGAVGLNSGTIKNVSISGLIKANDSVNLGGIVGNNTNKIEECANYGMVLEGYSLSTYQPEGSGKLAYTTKDKSADDYLLEQNVGGIVGLNTGTVDNVRTMFMSFDNGEVTISAKESYISGIGNVAGVIAKNTGNLTRIYVENFMAGEDLYNIIGSKVEQAEKTSQANVAGLVAVGGGKVVIGIVRANISAKGCDVCEFGDGLTLNYVYFVGEILLDKGQTISSANHAEQANVYIVEDLVYFDENVKNSTKNEYGVTGISTDEDYTQIDGTTYYIKWLEDVDKINDGYPYIVYKIGEAGDEIYGLTVKATEIIVNVDENYFDNGTHEGGDRFEKYEQGLYIQYNKGENATAVVYYYEGQDNIHKLVSDERSKGLVEKTIIPTIANGAYSVKIISGVDVAELISGSTSIKFKKTGKVVLKFISMFDSSVYDIVEIFVENALNDNVFTISTDESVLTNIEGEKYTTRAGTNSIINLGLNEVSNQKFDSTKVYMSASVTGEHISISPITIQKSQGYVLGGYEFSAETLPINKDKTTVTITFRIYLDLSAFELTSNTLDKLYSGESALLGEKTISITIYNSATAIRMSGDTIVSAGVSANIQVNLETGYKDEEDTDFQIVNSLTFSGAILRTGITGKDSIEVELEAVNDNAKTLVEYARAEVDKANQIASNQKQFTIWELFDVVVGYNLTKSGYLYQINLTLKDEYRRLYELGEDGKWIFKLTASATNNINVAGSVNIEFVPQQLDTFRLENYAKLAVSLQSDNASVEAEYVSSDSASSLIIPGSSGLIKVYAEKDYAYCENIKISSDIVEVDGQQYFVRFQQMTYNRERNVYESYAGITTDGTSLALERVSYIEGGKKTYTGVIFVRTILEKIVGVRKIFTITISATTYDIDGKAIEVNNSIALLSQYQPGVYISVENALKAEKDYKEIYLVKQGSTNVQIIAKVYGYQFNVLPTRIVEWIAEGASDEDVKGWGNIYDYVSISQSDIQQGQDEAYYISYTLRVNSGCEHPFKISFTMTLIEDGNSLTSNTETVNFYPVPYIIDGVRVKGVSNGSMEITIGSSKNLLLSWNETAEVEQAINDKLIDAVGDDFLNLFYIKKLNSNGNTEIVRFKQFKQSDSSQAFSVADNGDDTYRIIALSKASLKVYFDLYYGYKFVDGKFEIVFSTTATSVASTRIYYEFDLNLSVVSTEDMPRGIYTAEDLQDMAEGENYILFRDITLENWIPLTTKIGSLDGNGKVISIVSFDIAVSASVNAGLFAQVSEQTILKNVVVDIRTYQNLNIAINDNNVAESTINFGFLAGVNNGIIYNCEVISLGSAKTLEIVVGANYKLTLGGLVGQNNGNILNSRVGTEYFMDIDSSATGRVAEVKKTCGEISIKSSGIVAGLVGENTESGIISSSYVTNTSIENTQNKGNMEINRTAGFVATNAGVVSYSYVKGLERSILSTRSRATGSKIFASGAGSVAGFVFVNTGSISDCYSNIICESNSAVASGFVYDTTAGSIMQCYSASTVLSGNTDSALATELPFVGIGVDKDGAQQLLSNDSENMLNCYYLNDGQEYDTNYIVEEDKYIPVALSLEDFANPSYLNNFAFINGGKTAHQLNGVWTYSTAVDKNRSTYSLGITSLPELTSANKISRSIRYEPEQDGDIDIDELHDYPYANNYDRGSENNPYIIRNSAEYLAVFKGSDNSAKSKVGYIRFIDDISFENENGTNTNIPTREEYTLGDKGNNNLTVIDGNGMTIKGVVINYTKEDKGSIGLFSEIYYAVIKELNIEYSSSAQGVGTSTVVSAGGVAGKAANTFFIDINLTGAGGTDEGASSTSSVAVRATNVSGGLVGILTGENSGIYNVTSNLSATVGYGTENYSKKYTTGTDLVQLSYAGGLAGIIDIGEKSGDYANVRQITINSADIEGNRAGGVAGYLGGNVIATRLSYEVSSESRILGLEVAGGIVGENSAKIDLSQIGADLKSQHNFDKAFADYINDAESTSVIGTGYGNLSAVQGAGIIGGFAGINEGGQIDNSLTKANIGGQNINGTPKIVGGFIGGMYGGKLTSCYAQNYIDLSGDSVDARYVGGLIGVNYTSPTKVAIDNVVVATWFDKVQIQEIDSNTYVDYLVGSGTIEDNQSVLNYGDYLSNSELEVKNSVSWAQKFDMASLYNLDASTQKEIFESLFILWDVNYWDLNNTNFMPNLKQDSATSFIKLETADDLKKLDLYPNSNFILMQDITVGDRNSNYVANIDFTGILIGKMKDDGTYPTFKEIRLNADSSRSATSGFFRSTTNARIANVNFEYTNLNLAGTEFANVGGVSAEDRHSRYENVKVEGSITSNTNVVCVGSMVGSGKGSTIIGCESSVNITAKLGDKTGYIGGLVGMVDGSNTSEMLEEVNTYDALIRSTAYTGKITIQTDADATTASAFVGGITGKAIYTNITASNFGNADIFAGTKEFNVDLNSTKDNMQLTIGGLSGVVENSTMQSSSSWINVNVSKDIKLVDVGGIIGQTLTNDVLVADCYVKVSAAITDSASVNNFDIGGIVARTCEGESDSLATTIKEVYAEINIESMENIPDSVVVGGVVAIAGTAGVEIDKAVAYLNPCNMSFNKYLIGGGFIGQAQGNYKITNSMSMGRLFANSVDGLPDSSTLVVLGGMVGLHGKVNEGVIEYADVEGVIQSSITILTLSTAGIYQGTIKNESDPTKDVNYEVIVNAIVGQGSSKKISISNVVYSSDYCLAFDDDETKFDNMPVNYTANVLLDVASFSELRTLFDSGDWMVKDGAIPLPNLNGLLEKAGILENGEYNVDKGECYYPVTVDEWNTLTSAEATKYTYYILTSRIINVTGSITNLNGVILGCDARLSGNMPLVKNISKHSAISNVVYTIEETINGSGYATTNYGTIFMCGVEYSNVTINGQFGGFAAENYGNIAYCYNNGEASSVSGNAGGLVNTNKDCGSITYSYFTGVFNGLGMSAIANENAGYIGYCYSAGPAGAPIAKIMGTNGRYCKNYFDYYANFILEDEYDENVAEGLSTIQMQKTGTKTGVAQEGKKGDNYYSTLWAERGDVNYNWLVYSMSNVVYDAEFKVFETTYNYGYPIHNFSQKVASGGDLVNISLRAKPTGNGTYTEIGVGSQAQGNKVVGATGQEYDDNSYLLSHFGLLQMMSNLEDTTGKYFELEYDLEMPSDIDKAEYFGDIGGWNGIGQTTETAFKGIFSSISPLEGEEAYTLDESCAELGDGEFANVKLTISTPRIITNLTGAPLFNKLERGAVVANIVLNSSVVNSAPVAYSVGTDDGEAVLGTNSILIYNVSVTGNVTSRAGNASVSGFVNTVCSGYKLIAEKLSISGTIQAPVSSANQLSGLINTNKGEVVISNFGASEIKFKYAGKTGPVIAGVVHSNLSSDSDVASIIISGSKGLKITMETTSGVQVDSFSGLAHINEGTIISQDFALTIGDINEKCGNLAGCVNVMRAGLIGGFNVEFDADSAEKCQAEIFGGVVATFQGGQIGVDDSDGGTELPITVELKSTKARIYGGIIGRVENAGETETQVNCELVNVELSAKSTNVEVETLDEDEGFAYGLIVGQMSKELSVINYVVDNGTGFFVKNGVNVGGVVGVSSVNKFNFANDKQDLGTIKGGGNVGGFIGKYIGEQGLVFSGNDWIINSEDSFATISVYASDDIKNEQDRQGFGGLIGLWDSEATLQASIVSEDAGDDDNKNLGEIKNSNNVLSDSEDLEHFGYYKQDGKSIRYIGGIVGYSKASIRGAINQGTVGTESDEVGENKNGGLSPFDESSMETYANFMYIGGVVGYIHSESLAGGVSVINCSNTGTVGGAYCVGGVIGYANNLLRITSTTNDDKDVGDDNIVQGLINVGGVAGAVINETNHLISSFTISTSVVGLINVGGVVGCATNVEIADVVVVSPNILGNVNVGGLVGELNGGKIGTVSVKEDAEEGEGEAAEGEAAEGEAAEGAEPAEEEVELENTSVVVGTAPSAEPAEGESQAKTVVYGYVLGQTTKSTDEDGKEVTTYGYFLPVNIGGVVGRISAKDNAVEIDKTQTYARVETDKDYSIESYGDATDKKLTISMISNRLVDTAKVALIGKSISAEEKFEYYYNVSELIAYTAMDTGIGGFAGVVTGNYTFGTECCVYGDVYAEYGVNVGGSVGYAEMPNGAAGGMATSFPALPDDPNKAINVAGNTFVGGYIGKINSIQSGNFFDSGVNKVGFVNIQRYTSEDKDGNQITGVLAGNCIGGVFGYCMQSLANINLVHKEIGGNPISPIKIFNKADDAFGSSYIGCIVGRIDGEVKDCSLDAEICGAENKTIHTEYQLYVRKAQTGNEIIQEYDTFNYGGIAGLVNVPKGSTNSDSPFTIQGTHYYAFTIDSVQNRDYSQGTTQYNYDTSGANDTVSAIAHYVNMSNISISASKLNSMYDNDNILGSQLMNALSGAGYKYITNHNPINENYKGWAKEYTMFRMWSRVIDQPNESTGDSVQVIYNASYVTAVFTDYSVGKVGNAASSLNYSYSNNIIYTVYQPIGQTAMLYCKYGVAEYMESFDPAAKVKMSDTSEPQNFEKSYEILLDTLDKTGLNTTKYKSKTYAEILEGFAEYKKTTGSYGTVAKMLTVITGEEVDADNVSEIEAIWAKYPESVTETYLADKADDGQTSYFWYTGSGSSIRLGRDALWKHISTTEDIGVKEEDLDEDDFEKALSEAKSNAEKYQYTCGYGYYDLTGYMGSTEHCYFVFKTVYGWTPHKYRGSYIEEDRSVYSNSGSLFEVSGVPVTLKTVVYKGKVSGWTIALIVVGAIIVIAAVVASIYYGGPAVALLASALKGVTTIKSVIGTLIWVWKSTAIVAACVAGLAGGSALLATQINKAALASQDASENFIIMEDVSLGYLGSSYGRQLAWQNGKELSGMDGAIIVEVEARVESEVEFKPSLFIKELLPEDVYGEYENMGADELASINDLVTALFGCGYKDEAAKIKTFKIGEIYSCCQTSNLTPADFDVRVTVKIDPDTEDNMLKGLLATGITQYTVPMYIKVDNEIYVHTGTATGQTQVLYQNYAENVKTMKDEGLEEGIDFINDGGYMYVANDSSGVMPEDDVKELAANGIQVNREISRNQSYKLVAGKVDGKSPQQISAQEKELRWVLLSNPTEADKNSELVKSETTTYYYRDLTYNGSQPDGTENVDWIKRDCVVYGVSLDVDRVWVKLDNGETYVFDTNHTSGFTTADGMPAVGGEYRKASVYFVKDGTKANLPNTVTKYFKLTKSTEGIELKTGELTKYPCYYQYDKDGTITLPVTYYFYTGVSAFNDYATENGQLYMLADATALEGESTTLYKLGANGKVKNKEEVSFATLKNNFGTYQYYSISKESVVLVRDTYTVKAGKLYLKQSVSGFQVLKLGSGINYYIRSIATGVSPEGLLSWNYNKYVYNFNGSASGRSWDVKFFTRYRYEDNDNNFYNYELYDDAVAEVDENGVKVERSKYVLKDLIFNEGGNIIFVESVRVSLSAGSNTVVYKEFKLDDNHKISTTRTINNVGRIDCLL